MRRLAYTLAQLSMRERALLAVLALVAIPAAIVFFAVLPMIEARNSATARAQESEILLAWVVDQVRITPISEDGAGQEADSSAIGIAGIEDSLVAGGLRDRVAQLANRPDGGVDLALDDAPFTALTDWLQSMETTSGYQITAFRLDATSPGLVNAVFELAVK